jgi:hypothetical protein
VPFRFENREKELAQFVSWCWHNSKLKPNTTSYQKLILPLASQMLGSGKTWFGQFLIRTLGESKPMLSQEVDQGFIELVAKSLYILFDLHDLIKPYSDRKLLQ